MRIFVVDNHRPFHLENIHSPWNVVVFDDIGTIEVENAYDFIPSGGDDLSESFDLNEDSSSSNEVSYFK